MNALVKFLKVFTKNIKSLRKFYDDGESHFRSLSSLGLEKENYGALTSTLVLEKLPHNVKLIVTRKAKENTWDLAKVLELINQELEKPEP